MQTTSILGISMAGRSQRRYFVVITCLLWLAAEYALTLLHWRHFDFHVFLVAVFVPTSRFLFASLVRQSTFPSPRSRPVMLLHKMPFEEQEPDERELSVRDRAYFIAFRIMAAYVIAFFLFVAGFQVSSGMLISPKCTELALLPLVFLAFTLPQIVILWTEPDWPGGDEEPRLASARSH